MKKIKRLQREYWNAFKQRPNPHGGAEREDDELLQRFTDEQNDAVLFVGWADYGRATKIMPIEARVHHTWWITLNPDKVDPKISLTEYDRCFPRLREKPRAEQKRMLNEVIAWARTQKEHMADPRTDRRPLILGWGDPAKNLDGVSSI